MNSQTKPAFSATPSNVSEVSIIVPVYKAEKYIRPCLDSILAQSFPDFECILVNDASPDNCPRICDEYAKHDARIKVIHEKRNSGSSLARKRGLSESSGQYILFVDSDDWLEPEMVEKMYARAINTCCDMVISGAFVNTESGETEDQSPELSDKISIIKRIIIHGKYNASLWNKMVKRNLYLETVFPDHSYTEDRVITIQTIYAANKIEYLKDNLYHYRKNRESLCGSSGQDRKAVDEYHNLIRIVEFLSREKIISFVEPELVYRVNSLKLTFIKNRTLRKLLKEVLTNLYPESTRPVFGKKNRIGAFDKIILFLGIQRNPALNFVIDLWVFCEVIIKKMYRLFIPRKTRTRLWEKRNDICLEGN